MVRSKADLPDIYIELIAALLKPTYAYIYNSMNNFGLSIAVYQNESPCKTSRTD